MKYHLILRRAVPYLVQTACGLGRPVDRLPPSWLGLVDWRATEKDWCRACLKSFQARGEDPREYSP